MSYRVEIDGQIANLNTDNSISLLLSMEENNLNVKIGCTVGLCEVCKLKVLEGKENLIEIRDSIFDLEDDEILPCCYKIKGDVKFQSTE
jgi:ferredoxin